MMIAMESMGRLSRRKEKLGYYKIFIGSLSKILEGEDSAEGQIEFATACNDLLLFAPQRVIDALKAFRDEVRVSNPNKSAEEHDQLLSKLLFEMRRDIGVKPQDDPNTFKVGLQGAGVRSRSKSS